jgi:hypothetical protein
MPLFWELTKPDEMCSSLHSLQELRDYIQTGTANVSRLELCHALRNNFRRWKALLEAGD